jgi:hypothetical protein
MDKTLALLIVDVTVGTASVVMTWVLAPEVVDKVMIVVGLWQPVIVYVIKTWKDKEVALLNQGINPKTMQSIH